MACFKLSSLFLLCLAFFCALIQAKIIPEDHLVINGTIGPVSHHSTRPTFYNGKRYIFTGVTYIITELSKLTITHQDDHSLSSSGAYRDTVMNMWTNHQQTGTVTVGGQETGTCFLTDTSFGGISAANLGKIIEDAIESYAGATSWSITFFVKVGRADVVDVTLQTVAR